jgi:hypothetical protein
VIGLVQIPMTPDADGDLMSTDPSITLLTITENGYGKRPPWMNTACSPKPESSAVIPERQGRADIKTTDRNAAP